MDGKRDSENGILHYVFVRRRYEETRLGERGETTLVKVETWVCVSGMMVFADLL
jgi:hypothetical protein